MPDIWMDVDTALSEVPVNLLPLLDDTDFKTIEDAVAYNAAGMDLRWNFVTTGGSFASTAVTPTTAGTYDWTHQGDGIYTIEIPASGGASINNDTEGFGWFSGKVTGVLPFRGPIIGFRAAALNDSLVDAGTTGLLAPTTAGRTLDVTAGGEAGIDWANIGSPTTVVNLSGTTVKAVTDRVTANVDQIGGDDQSATDLKDFADAGYDPATNKVEGVKLADTLTTYTGNTPQTGDSFARLGAPAGASVSADVAAVKSDTGAIKAKTDNLPSDPADQSLIIAATDAVMARLGTPAGASVSADIAAIEAQTDDIGAAGAGLTAIPWNPAWDAEVESEVTDALGAYDPPTHAELTIEINDVQADVATVAAMLAAPRDIPPIVAEVTATQFGSNATAHAVAMPGSGLVEGGDLLLVLFANDGDATVTTPTGWTQLFTTASGTAARLSGYAKIAIGNEAGTTVDFVTSAAEHAAAQVYRIKKGNWYGEIAEGIHVGTATTGTSTAPNPPALAPKWKRINSLFIAVEGHDDGTSDTTAFPSNYAESVETASAADAANGCYLASAVRQTQTASEDPGTFAITSQEWIAQTIAIRPSQVPAVCRLDRPAACVTYGLVDSGATQTSIPTAWMDPPAVTTDQFRALILGFTNDTITAALRGQKTRITASTAGGTLTVEALSGTPVAGDKFVIE